MESLSQKFLFGHYDIFDTLKNLYLNKKFPNKIILSGEKGIGKCTLAYHIINYILSLNENHNYDTKNYKIFKYSSDPKVLTGEIEVLTNYAQRKKNLKHHTH